MILSSPILILLRYWVFQGAMYMNRAELLHRFSLELIFIVACYIPLSWYMEGFSLWLVTFLAAHTLSCMLNGHPFAVLVHDAGVHSVCYFKDKKKFLDYVEKMKLRMDRVQPTYLGGALVFGSIVKGVFRETSDLDVRFIANPGFINALLTANLVFIERLRATLCGFPMDLYMFRDDIETRKKMDVINEDAVALYADGQKMDVLFDNLSTLDEMRTELLNNENAGVSIKPPRAVAISSAGSCLSDLLENIDGVPLRATIATVSPNCRSPEVQRFAWKTLCFADPEGGIKNTVKNLLLSVYLILRDRPDHIITTGTNLVIPTCLIGKALGSRLIYIEMAEDQSSISATGRFLYRFSDLFIIREPALIEIYPKASLTGKEDVEKTVPDMLRHFTKRK